MEKKSYERIDALVTNKELSSIVEAIKIIAELSETKDDFLRNLHRIQDKLEPDIKLQAE